jgi:hypothetical protein
MRNPTKLRLRRIRWINGITTALVISIVVAGVVTFERARGLPHFKEPAASLRIAYALESALNNIHTEYGKLPDVGSGVTTNSPAGLKLLNILLGLDGRSDNSLNSGAIKFFSVKEGKDDKGGMIYSSDRNSVTGLYDPWGNPFTLIIDTQDIEELQFTFAGRPVHLKGRRAAAFSPGPDKIMGTADDVKTW